MAIEKDLDKIYLTQETASNFILRLKVNNTDVALKKNNFIKSSKDRIRVENTNSGATVYVNNKS